MVRRLVTAAIFLTLVSIAGVAWRDTDSPYVREVVIPVPGLRREVRLLEVADLQGREFGSEQSELARLLGQTSFDAAVLTGDMQSMPGSTRQPAFELVDVLRQHTSRLFCLPGNHDAPDLCDALAERGCAKLPAEGSAPFSSTDPTGRDVAMVYGRDAESISSARGSGGRLLVIAAHTAPDKSRLAAGAALVGGLHVYVAGHTHGGQIRLPLVGAIAAPLSWSEEERAPAVGNEITLFPDLRGRFVSGMYHVDGQDVHVSTGLGTTGFGIRHVAVYVRFLCRAEVVLFRFVPAP